MRKSNFLDKYVVVVLLLNDVRERMYFVLVYCLVMYGYLMMDGNEVYVERDEMLNITDDCKWYDILIELESGDFFGCNE